MKKWVTFITVKNLLYVNWLRRKKCICLTFHRVLWLISRFIKFSHHRGFWIQDFNISSLCWSINNLINQCNNCSDLILLLTTTLIINSIFDNSFILWILYLNLNVVFLFLQLFRTWPSLHDLIMIFMMMMVQPELRNATTHQHLHQLQLQQQQLRRE